MKVVALAFTALFPLSAFAQVDIFGPYMRGIQQGEELNRRDREFEMEMRERRTRIEAMESDRASREAANRALEMQQFQIEAQRQQVEMLRRQQQPQTQPQPVQARPQPNPTTAPGITWKVIHHLPNGVGSYEPRSIVRNVREGTVKLWARFTYSEPQEFLPGKSSIRTVVTLNEIQCDQKLTRPTVQEMYPEVDITGVVPLHRASAPNSQFKTITPNTFGEAIMKIACKKPTRRSTL